MRGYLLQESGEEELMSNRCVFAGLVGAASVAAWSSFAPAATLVDYKPLPVSQNTPEFIFAGPLGAKSLQSGLGVIGNADGVLPVPAQTPGGIDAETPFLIPGIPGSQLNVATGTTEFYDTTLVLHGLVANAAAVPAGSLLIQSLGNGSFELLSTDPDGVGPLLPTLLLSGTIANSSFIVGTGDSAGEFNSLGVNYNGGVIYAAMTAAFGNPNGNSMSISMLDVTPTLAIDSDGLLRPFDANGTGLFSYTPGVAPEPASAAMLGIAGAALMLRRRRRQA